LSEIWMLSEAQTRRIEPYFPLSHGIPRVDDHRIVSGIIFVIGNGLHWRDAPPAYGPHKTIYNRFIRWSRLTIGEAGECRGQPCVRVDAGEDLETLNTVSASIIT
jgi:hypothetical protein